MTDADAAKTGWIEAASRFEFHNEAFAGAFDFDRAGGILSGRIDSGGWSDFQELLRVRRIEYRSEDRKTTLVPAIVRNVVVQGPHLGAAIEFEDPHGFAATQRLTVRRESLECEVRLLTVRPVESIAVELSFRSATQTPVSAADCTDSVLDSEAQEVDIHRRRSRVLRFGPALSPTGCAFVDVGERGRVFTPWLGDSEAGGLLESIQSGSLRVELFHRPLEKGVILVGRISLRPWRADPRHLRAEFEQWCDETPFL